MLLDLVLEKLLEKIKNEVELLAKHEEAVGFLYDRFSYRFPEKKFWIKLSQDEEAHAKIIRGLFDEVGPGKIMASPDVFPSKELIKKTKKLEKTVKNIKDFSLIQALKLAYKIESDITEAGYFKMFYPVNDEFKKVFSYLQKAADHHSQKVLKELKKVETYGKI